MSVELDADAYCDGFEQISFQNFSYVPFAFYADDTNTEDIENLITENQIASEQVMRVYKLQLMQMLLQI